NTARHRARRFGAVGGTVLDLCCGIGGDLAAVGAATGTVVGVDRDEVHAIAARHNAEQYDVQPPVVVADVLDVRADRAAAVFVDPARRRTSTGVDRRGGSSPPLAWCLGITAPYVAVKTAPGLDLAHVPDGWEAEFVAIGRDLKETVLWSPSWAQGRRRATVLHEAGTATILADPTV